MNVKLLRKVKDYILAEPRRLDMECWSGSSSEAPCGTRGCIAGWTAILAGKTESNGSGWQMLLGDRQWDTVASEILKLNPKQANRLFRFKSQCTKEFWPKKFSYAYKRATSAVKRAEVTAARIEHFIKTKGAE